MWPCLARDRLAQTSLDLGADVDLAAQQVFQVSVEGPKIEQAPTALDVDEEVDVAPLAGFAAGNRSKDADVEAPWRAAMSRISPRRARSCSSEGAFVSVFA